MDDAVSEAEATLSPEAQDAVDLAIDQLAEELGIVARLEDRVLRLTTPVPGSPHLAILQALGWAAKAAPIGGVAHGPNGVAAAVWLGPELYIARWTGKSRWVSAFKFSARARADEYLREESGIPSHLNRGSWYGDVPDEVAEAFFTVGLLLDEAPFPVPQPPEPPPAPAKPARSSTRAPAAPREPRAPRAPRKRAEPAAPKRVAPATRTCAMCNLQKHPGQFIEGSDLCVDCR
jgi:hypothetical protein